MVRLAILLGSALAVLQTGALAECEADETRLRFHHTAAERGNARGEVAHALAERINAELDGRACMTVAPEAEDHTDATLPDALSEGRFEIGAIDTATLGTVSRRFLVFDLPFLFDGVPSVLAFQASDTGQALLTDTLGEDGLRGLAFVLDGFDQIVASRPLRVPGDVEGLDFRTGNSELAQATVTTIGAVPVALPEREIPDALVTGQIDAADGSWSALRSSGAAAAAGGLTETNHTVQQFMLVAATSFWDGLAPDLRADLEAMIIEVAFERNKLSFELNEAAKYAMIGDGRPVFELSEAERLAWKRAMQEVWFGFGGEIGFDQISTALHTNRFN
ncbi:MAG: TRAP transporter substrate-binding protein DctP [Paracoccaceae bacterium]